jgi:predicted AAA+ superfamily ATPase
MQSLELFFRRSSTNKIGDTSIQKQIGEIKNSSKNRAQANGVVGEAFEQESGVRNEESGKYSYSFKLLLKKEKYRSETAALKCIEAARKFALRAAEARGWESIGDSQEQADKEAATELRPPMTFEPLTPEIYSNYFTGIYEREPHIRLIHSATRTFIESSGEERNHVLLYGEPAAAKTILFKAFKEWYDDEVERVCIINSTTTSKAGLENWILEKAQTGLLPEILWFDEIEKFTNENDISCLLSIMDGSGEIFKMNARIGKQSAKARVLVWGTCNNFAKLRAWNSGAIWSRFGKRLACVRPGRELMLKILLEKLDLRRRRGRMVNEAWATAAVNYGFDVAKTNDPREILSYLDGGDGLLDGSYFQDLEDVKSAEMAARKILEN